MEHILATCCFRPLKTCISLHKEVHYIGYWKINECGMWLSILDSCQVVQYQFHAKSPHPGKLAKTVTTSIDLTSEEIKVFQSLLGTSHFPLILAFDQNAPLQILHANTRVLLVTLPIFSSNIIIDTNPLEDGIELHYNVEDLIKTMLNISGVNAICSVKLENSILHYHSHSEDGWLHISKPMKVDKLNSFSSSICTKYVNTLRNLLHLLKICKVVLYSKQKQIDCVFRMESNCFCRFSFFCTN